MEIQKNLEMVLNNEQEAYDNIPESLQESERAEESEEAINTLDDVLSNISDAIDMLEGVF